MGWRSGREESGRGKEAGRGNEGEGKGKEKRGKGRERGKVRGNFTHCSFANLKAL